MRLNTYLQQEVEKFLQEKMRGFSCYVLGLSGGVDSALVAALVQKACGNDALLTLVLPIDSAEEDLLDAAQMVKKFNLNSLTIDLSSSYHHLLTVLEEKALENGKPLDHLAKINLKVRLRMVTLYAFAQTHHALVVGTDNADEYYTGYFTKYGDGGVDLLPIVHLTKGEVMQAARLYGVPASILNKKPSAGLFAGQTDEGEMGLSYHDLDRYLLGEEVSDEVKTRIEQLHQISAHKREPLPRPGAFQRD